MDSHEQSAAAERLEEARAGSLRLIDALTRQWDELVAASDMSNADDEHDPEGATIAFERARLGDSLLRIRADLEALDLAADRLRNGDYWICERCAGPIPPARLSARPTARTCVPCATAGRRAPS
ncbi:MAG: TraR/DksA family transcriptional regulator [Streptosporangiaceae bacterium]